MIHYKNGDRFIKQRANISPNSASNVAQFWLVGANPLLFLQRSFAHSVVINLHTFRDQLKGVNYNKLIFI